MTRYREATFNIHVYFKLLASRPLHHVTLIPKLHRKQRSSVRYECFESNPLSRVVFAGMKSAKQYACRGHRGKLGYPSDYG